MLFFQLVLAVCFRSAHTGLHVTYNITNGGSDVNLYKTARALTANNYVGAKCKRKLHAVCEPLTFDWLETESYEDNIAYLIKTCVVETFENKVLNLFLKNTLIFDYQETRF